ncbi:MAG: hypothetical protein HY248_00645, partial [Fimbriimonas ginsengisoli]|nr:hypothetical protein [Fimbriimonas ginsengisoli]
MNAPNGPPESASLMPRRRALLRAGCWVAASALTPSLAWLRLAAAEPGLRYDPRGLEADLIAPPKEPADWPAFRALLSQWRTESRRRLGYRDTLYTRPEFAWAQACFSCAFVMLADETFYDARRGRYTVEDFLAQGRCEFGGYDALVLWHAYPRIGLDDRNQFGFYRHAPGGLPGLRDVSRRCRRERVRVFIDYNPWDTGTRREPRTDLEALADLVREIEADGIFLDTMSEGAGELRANLEAARPGVILEGEGALPLERIHDHHASWAQWFPDGHVPGILRNKWFERRHLQHQIRRWDHDHTGELHTAWINGSGMLVWENVFGTFVGWCPHDASLLRAMLPIQRRYLDLFTGDGWTPLVATEKPEVFASQWDGRGLRLWTL